MLSRLRFETPNIVIPWAQKLFRELIELAQLHIGEIDRNRKELLEKNTLGTLLGVSLVLRKSSDPSPVEADSVLSDIVEALVLAGDVEAAEKAAKSISEDGYDEIVSSRQEIIKGWVKKDPDRALQMALNPILKYQGLEDPNGKNLTAPEDEDQKEDSLFDIMETIAETSKPDYVVMWITQVLPKYCEHQEDEDRPCLICRSRDILVRAIAATGNISGARYVAGGEHIPAKQVPVWLGLYEFSQATEDLEKARKFAEKIEYHPEEDWLTIAEATHERQDIERAKKEVMGISGMDYFHNLGLLELAKITRDPQDLVAAREVLLANPDTGRSLLMELCRITRDPKDFALLLEKQGDDEDRYSALACIAEITRQETDFLAATKEALSIKPVRYASPGYLRGRSLVELALVLCGKPISR